MITDPKTVSSLQAEWSGVLRMQERMKLLLVATFAGGAFTSPALGGVVYNLPLLLAVDVLQQVLNVLKHQGAFQCHSSHLGPLVDAAKPALPWLDWQRIRDGVRRRNEVAHDGVLHDAQTCNADIAAIGSQLVAWGVLDAA
jgi:hypothetical protein